eukprot:gb/GECG01006822.1/.p1 GENE.gb/GECG01006822.1/~~gb/GECG01006822.1/.p1  ORF type:complete len:148 (+),score=5.12 gb/GECG01006822.1/:1-444(+)
MRLNILVLLLTVFAGYTNAGSEETIFDQLAHFPGSARSMLRRNMEHAGSSRGSFKVPMTGRDPSIVNTTLGQIQGQVVPEGRKFRSIPYAQPPTGDLRWESPRMVNAWQPTVLQATQDPPGCYQHCSLPPHTCPKRVTGKIMYQLVS